MGRPPQRPAMVDVELLDDDAATAAPGSGSSAAGTDAPRGDGGGTGAAGDAARHGPGLLDGRRRRAVLAAAGAAVVAVAVVLAVLPGASGRVSGDLGAAGAPDLTLPPAELWRTEVGSTYAVAGSLLTTVARDGDDLLVRAVRLADGEPVWVSRLPGDGVSQLWCPHAVDGPSGPALVCQARGGLMPLALPGAVVQDPGRMLVLDGGDGRLLWQEALGPRHLGLAEVDGDLLVGTAGRRALTLVRRDLARGVPVWSTEVPGTTAVTSRSRRLVVRDGLVAVTGPDLLLVDATDGALVGRWQSDPRIRRDTSRDLVVAPHGVAVRPAGAPRSAPSLWRRSTGATTPVPPAAVAAGQRPTLTALPGDAAEPAVTDGSTPDVVLVRDARRRLVGATATDGARRWSVATGADERPLLRAGGVVLLAGPRSLRSLDLRTGAERWRLDEGAEAEAFPVSDGRFVLTVGRAASGVPTLAATSLTDGSALWRVALPPGTRDVVLAGGRVLATGPGVVVGLG